MKTMELASTVPYRVNHKGIEILLVTSRGKRDWIFPKGRLDEGDSIHKAAERETWEEAGILGHVDSEPFAVYLQPRSYGFDSVRVFLMPVKQELEDWPEKGERKRKWVPLDRLRKTLKKEVLIELVPAIHQSLEKQAAAA